MNESVTPAQKAQGVLWLLELKTMENIKQKWLDTYKCQPPSENAIKQWMENFTKFGNVEGDHQPPHMSSFTLDGEAKQSASFTDQQHRTEISTKEQNAPLDLQPQSFGDGSGHHFSFKDKTTTLEMIRQLHEDFSNERDWNQYHSPRNILLALVGEVGELAEIFQWKNEVKKGIPNFTDAEREHVGEELSDVLIYLIRLADRCEIDLPSAALKKFEKNAKKYPAKKVYGKSKKYNEYQSS